MKRILCVITILSTIFWLSCTKSKVEIDFPSQNAGNSSNSSNGSSDSDGTASLITFSAYVEGLNLTRSMTPIQTDVLASIYAYDSASNTLIASGNYQSNSLGTLTGLDDYKMYLTNGIYDFFAVSSNANSGLPTFSNAVSSPLVNGVDYLWWSLENKSIVSISHKLDIVFTHKASQVVFSISDGNGIVVDSLASILTTAPTEGVTMNLKTGVITPSTTRQTGFKNRMGINGTTAQSILLPASNWNFMAVSITAYINSSSSPSIFTAQVPIPNGTLKAGNSYQYSLVLSADSVITQSVEVADWTIVKDNVPIYPTEL